MKTRVIVLLIFSLAVLILFYSTSHVAVSDCRQDLGVGYKLRASSFPPDLMKVFAGEFKGLWSDYLLLETGAFIGSNRWISQEEWKEIALVLEQALELDPYFQQTYIYVQGYLPWDANMVEKAVSLLDISRKHRPWDWRPGYYMGFDYYYFLKDYSRASEIFLDTAKIEGSPVLLAVLGGRFALKSGRTETAIALLQSMLEDPGLDEQTETEISDRVEALRGILFLENAIERYKKRYNVHPPSLETLIEKGFVRQLPRNPYSDRYFYDPKDGYVLFDEIG